LFISLEENERIFIMKKFIGLDVGDVRIGVAKCDPLGILATALEVIDRNVTDPIERIKEILSDEGTRKIVVGMPKSLDGTKNIQAEKVEKFISEMKEKIERIEVITVDERYTTTEAEHYLKNYSKKNGKERRKVVDMVAASIILQKYLDTLK
jgi:RNAse H domain protein, YqgF family